MKLFMQSEYVSSLSSCFTYVGVGILCRSYMLSSLRLSRYPPDNQQNVGSHDQQVCSLAVLCDMVDSSDVMKLVKIRIHRMRILTFKIR